MMPFRVGEQSSSDASPSVSMERGTYRMRAPRTLKPLGPLDFDKPDQQGPRRPTRNRQQDLLNRNLSLLLALLTLACIGCFGAAYYLFSTRCAALSRQRASALANSSTEALVASSITDIAGYVKHKLDVGERFLAYLPHSGFHNQRIEFQNALVLARLLNRTLLAPPVHLAQRSTRHLKFDTLYQALALSGREGMQHCATIPPYLVTPPECLHYHESTTIPWNMLFDLSSIQSTQPVVYLSDLSHLAAIRTLNFPPGKVWVIPDERPYQYRFRGEGATTINLNKYEEDIHLTDLQDHDFPLIQLGSLFGSRRLILPPHQIAIQDAIRTQMVFGHPALTRAARLVKQSLAGDYAGIHVRVGDGQFFHNRRQTSLKIWCTLLKHLGYDNVDIQRIAQLNNLDFDLPINKTGPCQAPSLSKSYPSRLNARMDTSDYQHLQCRGPPGRQMRSEASKGPFIPLFISTDLESPRSQPLLLPILKTFPCSFFLDDFRQEIMELQVLKNPVDGVNLAHFFLPFLDAMVVANAIFVVGTEGSTFSSYIETILWPSYHNSRHSTGTS